MESGDKLRAYCQRDGFDCGNLSTEEIEELLQTPTFLELQLAQLTYLLASIVNTDENKKLKIEDFIVRNNAKITERSE